MELYELVTPSQVMHHQTLVRRMSDRRVAYTPLSRLRPHGDTGYYVARSSAVALRLENLEWKNEKEVKNEQ